MKKGIYKFSWDCGRMGEVEGVFVSTDEDVKGIQGKDIYFGEILGKHSEVYGTIDEGEIVLLTENKEAVDVFSKHDLGSGYNPFDYIQDDDEEEDEDLEDDQENDN